MLLNKVKAVLHGECGLNTHQKILVGVSGGMDSMALLDLLVRAGYAPVVAHFNHQLRPSALQEQKFVEKAAKKYGLLMVIGSVDIQRRAKLERETMEEAARNARYRFLFDEAHQHDALAVVVAHQADDQVETVLMNLLRGCGLNGLSGMRYSSASAFHASIPLVRPLLGCWRDEIQRYCTENGIAFVQDESNEDASYRRNRIRLELIPQLVKYNPQVKAAIWQMAELLAADRDFIAEDAADAKKRAVLRSDEGYAEIDLQDFREFPKSLQRWMIRQILHESFPHEKDLGAYQIEEARALLAGEMSSRRIALNHRVMLHIEANRAIFMEKGRSQQPAEDWPALEKEIRITIRNGRHILSKRWMITIDLLPKERLQSEWQRNSNPHKAYLDRDQLGNQLHIRKWRAGDRYEPLGMAGKSVKLSDLWINHKIPPRAKSHWPLLLDGDSIIWIPGFQPCRSAAISQQTKQVCLIELIETEN